MFNITEKLYEITSTNHDELNNIVEPKIPERINKLKTLFGFTIILIICGTIIPNNITPPINNTELIVTIIEHIAIIQYIKLIFIPNTLANK